MLLRRKSFKHCVLNTNPGGTGSPDAINKWRRDAFLQSKANRARAAYANLTKHYRAIGPAAIAAAVLVAKKQTLRTPPRGTN